MITMKEHSTYSCSQRFKFIRCRFEGDVLMPRIWESIVVSLLSHVLDGDQVSSVPLPMQCSEHLGRFLRVLGLDVDATLRTFCINCNVQNLGTVTNGATLQDLLLNLPHPGIGVACSRHAWIATGHGLAIKHVTNFQARGGGDCRGRHTLAETAKC